MIYLQSQTRSVLYLVSQESSSLLSCCLWLELYTWVHDQSQAYWSKWCRCLLVHLPSGDWDRRPFQTIEWRSYTFSASSRSGQGCRLVFHSSDFCEGLVYSSPSQHLFGPCGRIEFPSTTKTQYHPYFWYVHWATKGRTRGPALSVPCHFWLRKAIHRSRHPDLSKLTVWPTSGHYRSLALQHLVNSAQVCTSTACVGLSLCSFRQSVSYFSSYETNECRSSTMNRSLGQATS